MPSFAISKFTVLLGPRWVSAEFLCLSTGPNLDGTERSAAIGKQLSVFKIAVYRKLYIPLCAELCYISYITQELSKRKIICVKKFTKERILDHEKEKTPCAATRSGNVPWAYRLRQQDEPQRPPKHGGYCEKGFSEDRLHQRAAFPYHL